MNFSSKKNLHQHLPLIICITAFFSQPTLAQDTSLEEIIITGVRNTHTVRTEETLVAPVDTTSLLKHMPGANINKNGELTGIAQYRGMYGDRVNIDINGAHISSSGPNAMDAPLHYAPVAILESLTIYRGITPVSIAQESIGGHVEALTYSGDFGTGKEYEVHSRIYAGSQTANSGIVGSGFFSLSNDQHLFRATLMQENGDDSEFADGLIRPSEYERDRFDLGYSFRQGAHRFDIDVGVNNTGDAGTAALPMDILSVDSRLYRSRYQWQGDSFTLDASFSYNDLEHWMTNYHLRRPPQNGALSDDLMRFRQTFATSENTGFSIKLSKDVSDGLWRFGIDGHSADHNAQITNPNAAPFFIDNFNNSNRQVIGTFIERELALSDNFGLEGGIRINRVSMDTERVAANLNPMNLTMGMPVMMNAMASNIASQFNSQDLSQSNTNIDWFTRLSLETQNSLTWYLGLARKNRTPSYQERYLWLPLEATGGLADGKTYIGNPALDSELSHELELGFDLESGNLQFYPRIFYKKVEDYIQGTPSTNMPVNMFAAMMASMGMGSANPLQFNNVDATFYGIDAEASYSLDSHWHLRANLSMVRGERNDINDDLFRISPDNLLLALDYQVSNWVTSLEGLFYARQDSVSSIQNETPTEGYGVLNVAFRMEVTSQLEIGLGINNLLDKSYQNHLGAYNRAFNPDIPTRDRLPGMGRNLYGRVIWQF